MRSGALTRKTAGGWKMSLDSLGQLKASIHETHELSPQQKEAHSIGLSGGRPLPFAIPLKLCRYSSILGHQLH
jgi:hypothetical protein